MDSYFIGSKYIFVKSQKKHININNIFNAMFKPIIKSSFDGNSCGGHSYKAFDTQLHADYRITKIHLS